MRSLAATRDTVLFTVPRLMPRVADTDEVLGPAGARESAVI